LGKSPSKPDLLSRDFEPDNRDQILLEPFPPCPVEIVTQLAVVVHLAPAIAAPLTASHINHKIPVLLIVVDAGVVAIVRAGSGGEAVDFPLRDERRVWPNPWLVDIEKFKSILFFVFPFHVLLFVPYRVPPYVQQAIGPSTTTDEEGAQVEARAVLREDEIDRIYVPVAFGAPFHLVEVFIGRRMRDVEGVIFIDVTVDVLLEVVEDVVLKRVAGLHDEGVQVEPPEPVQQRLEDISKGTMGIPPAYHSALGYFLRQ